MHTPSRRSFFAVAAATTPLPLAAADFGAAGEPDAELLELDRKHRHIRGALDIAYEAAGASQARAQALIPTLPDCLIQRADDWFTYSKTGRPVAAKGVECWRQALAQGEYRSAMSAGLAANFESRGREVVEAWDAHRLAISGAEQASGFRDAVAEEGRLGDELYAVEQRIFAMRATTLAGWRVKARIAAGLVGEPDGTYEDFVMRSLLADLLRDEAPANLQARQT